MHTGLSSGFDAASTHRETGVVLLGLQDEFKSRAIILQLVVIRSLPPLYVYFDDVTEGSGLGCAKLTLYTACGMQVQQSEPRVK